MMTNTSSIVHKLLRCASFQRQCFAILWSLSVIGLCIDASPVIRLPLKRDISISSNSVMEVRENNPAGKSVSNLHGVRGQGYYIEVAIGKPAQMINVLIDTGSSNFAVAASPHFSISTFFNVSNSLTLDKLGTEVYVPYVQGSWKGFLGKDIITLPFMSSASKVRVNIAFITESTSFFINGSNWQGILGLAYSEIARPDASIEPFFDSLVSQTQLANIFSMQLCGHQNDTSDTMGGTLLFGGIDSSLYIGELVYVALRREWYYEVVIVDMAIGSKGLSLDCKEYNYDKTIVDSGTTNLRLPTRVFEALIAAVKLQTNTSVTIPESFWQGNDLLCWAVGLVPWGAFPTLTISLASSANETMRLVVSPQQYLRLVGEGEQRDGGYLLRADSECVRLSIVPSDTGAVIGAVIMEGYYVVFDRQNKRLGFAQTSCGSAMSHRNRPSCVEGPFHHEGDTSDCAFVRPFDRQSPLNIAAYVMIAICTVCLLIAAVALFHRRMHGKCPRRTLQTPDDDNLLRD